MGSTQGAFNRLNFGTDLSVCPSCPAVRSPIAEVRIFLIEAACKHP